jgi:hypothetical protein
MSHLYTDGQTSVHIDIQIIQVASDTLMDIPQQHFINGGISSY